MSRIHTVALIDDDEIVQFITKKIIGDSGFVDKVKVFNNGLEAINYLSENAQDPEKLPEIILLDLNMPVMDGFEFMEEYNKLKPKFDKQMTLFVVSSAIAPDLIRKIKEMHDVTDYVVKPISIDKFRHICDLLKDRGGLVGKVA